MLRSLIRSRLIIVLCVVLLSSSVIPYLAGAQELTLQKTWGGCPAFGSPFDAAEGVAVAPDGSIYVVGRTQPFGANPAAGDENAFIIKLAPSGSVPWQKTWGGANQDIALSVAVGQDGSVYVAGRTLSFGQGNGDAFILKLDPNGNSIWQRTWGTPASELKTSVAVDPNGNVYVVGETGLFSPAETFILKFDSNGNLFVQKHWSGGSVAGGNEHGDGIAVAPDGSVYVGGTRDTGTITAATEAFVLKLNPTDLSVTWGKTWGGASIEDATGIAANNDGVAAVGLTLSFGNASFLVKFDPAGNLTLQKTLPTSAIGIVNDVAFGPDGSIYVVSGNSPATSGFTDAHLVRFTSNGALESHRFLDSSTANLNASSVTTGAGNICVAGTSNIAANMTMGPMTLEEPTTPVTVSTPAGNVGALAITTQPFVSPPVPQPQSVALLDVNATIGPSVPPCASDNDEAFVTCISALQSGEVAVSPGVKVTLEGGQLFGFLVDTCSASSPNFNPADCLCHYPLSVDSNTARLQGKKGNDTFVITDGLGADSYVIFAHGGNDSIKVVDSSSFADHYRIKGGTGFDTLIFCDAPDLGDSLDADSIENTPPCP